MKKFIKFLFIISVVFSVSVFGTVIYFDNVLGDDYCVAKSDKFSLSEYTIVDCEIDEADFVAVQKSGSNIKSYKVNLSILGFIPIKNVNVTISNNDEVVVLGTPFGIKILSSGVMVIGFNDVETYDGAYSPAKNAGIKVGDIILSIDGKSVSSNNDVVKAVTEGCGQAMEFSVKRGDKVFNVTVKSAKSRLDNKYKIGLWVRDSSAGIGTLTFYNPETNIVAGLGHGICDSDTEELIPLKTGEFVEAQIVGIKKSSKSTTGELQGVFLGGKIAEIVENSITGVYGECCGYFSSDYVMPVALKQEVKTGEAEILVALDGGEPKKYKCEIEKVYHKDSSLIKNMIIRVTDSGLIEKTGGIVQGMSGSPIIQNGKLIGAVTHVLVDDPTKGYGIFAENMIETAQNVVESNKLKDVS